MRKTLYLFLLCWWRGHQWRVNKDTTITGKRWCSLCDEEQWLFSREFPRIGEPKMFWVPMNRRTTAKSIRERRK